MGCRLAISLCWAFVLLQSAAAQEGKTMLSLTSPAFVAGQPIPKKYTCAGGDVSPPLAWSGVPASAKSLALIVDDPDAPDPKAPTRVWVHWVVYNVAPSATSLVDSASGRNMPAGAAEGTNDWSRGGYGGPCPPIGRHRYFFKLYALDSMLPLGKALTKAALEQAMQGHIVAQAELIGTYQKGDN
jgi:Raf kinase inhibitor-like YbhB/YbcL family protein